MIVRRCKVGNRQHEHWAWRGMLARCHRTSHADWPSYGGRGISVCDSWRSSFDSFYSDMGARPGPGYSIDRINNDGNYEPGNCRWATAKQQRANQRQSKAQKLSPDDVTAIRERKKTTSGRALAEEFGVATSLIFAIVTRKIWRHVP